MSVFIVRERGGCVYICVVVFSCPSVCSTGASVRQSGGLFGVYANTRRLHVCMCIRVSVPPAPSLGRRQSQCWGCSSAAPAASQANLRGEKHFDPGLQV